MSVHKKCFREIGSGVKSKVPEVLAKIWYAAWPYAVESGSKQKQFVYPFAIACGGCISNRTACFVCNDRKLRILKVIRLPDDNTCQRIHIVAGAWF